MFLPRVKAGRGRAKPMAAASHLCSLMLNPSRVRWVLAQLALGTVTGLMVVVAATGFLAHPSIPPLPCCLPAACCLPVAFATCSSIPAHAPGSPGSRRAGDGWCWGTFVSYQVLEASFWSLAALFAYEIVGLQRANPE